MQDPNLTAAEAEKLLNDRGVKGKIERTEHLRDPSSATYLV